MHKIIYLQGFEDFSVGSAEMDPEEFDMDMDDEE